MILFFSTRCVALSLAAFFCTVIFAPALNAATRAPQHADIKTMAAIGPRNLPAKNDSSQVRGYSNSPYERILKDLEDATQDSVASTPSERKSTGMNASALGSSWPEIRIVPENDRLLGSIWGWRKKLSQSGFDFTLTYLAEGVGNVSGGRKRGFTYSHQIVFGTDFDLEKMAGLRGLSFHMLGINRAGRSVGRDYLGDTSLIQPQQDYGVGGNVVYKLVYMYLEQTLWHGKVTIDAGHMPANLKYGTAYFGCYSLNSIICAHETGLSVASKWRSWPFSQWGGTVKIKPGHDLYMQAGFYEASATEGGRAGFDFSFRPLGYVVPMEIGWEPSLGRHKLTGHYKLGGYFDTSNHPDPFTAYDGTPIPLTRRAPKIERQRGAWYVGADQMIARFGPAKDQGLTVFGIAGFNQGASLAGQNQYTIGIISQGMFPSRITDAISLFWSWQSVNRKITRAQEMQQDLGYSTLRGGVTMPQSSFQVLELTYTAFITRGLKLLPDIQYIVHPDANTKYPNAVEMGFRLLAQF